MTQKVYNIRDLRIIVAPDQDGARFGCMGCAFNDDCLTVEEQRRVGLPQSCVDGKHHYEEAPE